MIVEHHLKSGLKVRVRPFEQKDLRTCVGLMFSTYKPPQDEPGKKMWLGEMKAFWPDELASTARKRDYHIAESGGEAIGMIGIERFQPAAWRVEEAKRFGEPADLSTLQSPPAEHILELEVAPEIQCKHVGRLLLLAAMLRKIEQGVEHFYAYAPAHALPLLRHGGFVASTEPVTSVMWGAAHSLRARVPAENKGELQDALRAIQAHHAAPALALLPA